VRDDPLRRIVPHTLKKPNAGPYRLRKKSFSASKNLAGAKAQRFFFGIYGTSKLVP